MGVPDMINAATLAQPGMTFAAPSAVPASSSGNSSTSTVDIVTLSNGQTFSFHQTTQGNGSQHVFVQNFNGSTIAFVNGVQVFPVPPPI
jgi:hypothetical protein